MTYPPALPASSSVPPVVLVVEDDSAAAELLRLLLERVGYRVTITNTGGDAIQRVEEGAAPDIMLLDWVLPDMAGLDVCRRIRERFDPLALPILVVTARTDADSVAAAFAAGANDHISKPYLSAELRARIAAHLRIKQLSEERRVMDEHLMERDKLSTLGLLVSGVAHDLNNPLGGIYGYSQLLLEQETNPERLIALERIISEVKRCNRIVGDLLSFARRQAPQRMGIDLGDVLASTLALRDRQLRLKGVSPLLVVAPDLPIVVADPHQLQQVFVNILVNAEHALSLSGETLSITADRLVEPEDGIEWLTIAFYNDGPPIPPDVITHIFDPFFTTKEKDEGTGLGLAICRRIVREHGGEIDVTSGPQGTTFTILLPPQGADATPTSHRLAS